MTRFRGHRNPRNRVKPTDLSGVTAALDAYQREQQAASKALAYVSHHREQAKSIPELAPSERHALEQQGASLDEAPSEEFKIRTFLDAVRNYLFRDWHAAALSEIVAAVSAAVTDDAVRDVGQLPLTAFTTGLPYSFVCKLGADWADKPIGHVAEDASLLVMSELFQRARRRPPLGFNLVFDPGFFRTKETEVVEGVLRQHHAHSLVLKGDAASLGALTVLPATLPAENIFFNTHGSDSAILLTDISLAAHLIVQWIDLYSSPFVFNNSCLSWVGVGREFVRVGARGYVGTLWSVDASAAADFAEAAMARAVNGEPYAHALCQTGVAASTSRAYLYVGLVDAKGRRPYGGACHAVRGRRMDRKARRQGHEGTAPVV
ncbi:MAG TPA: hypothetical protein VHW23_20920 [Kofleriaceae bacterium]|nr:hypothetical protein [Kofleriaceae bacterium]